MFESLYAGTPSIFTRVGGVGDIVEDGREALVVAPQVTTGDRGGNSSTDGFTICAEI